MLSKRICYFIMGRDISDDVLRVLNDVDEGKIKTKNIFDSINKTYRK